MVVLQLSSTEESPMKIKLWTGPIQHHGYAYTASVRAKSVKRAKQILAEHNIGISEGTLHMWNVEISEIQNEGIILEPLVTTNAAIAGVP